MIGSGWQDLFPDYILDRGEDYAISGRVRDLMVGEDRITASVHGSSVYRVSIDLKNGMPIKMSCNCPYADGENQCKHMAAVLYEADADALSEETEGWQKTNITDLLEKADRQQLIAFINEFAMNDPAVANLLRVRFSESLSAEDIRELKREVDDIFRSHEIKGYINYHEAFAFQVDIDHFLTEKTDALLAHGGYAEAFEITKYVFVKLANTDIDDEGEIESISAICYDIWKRIVSSCGEPVYTKIRNWFEKNAYEGTLIDFMEEILQEFLETEMASEEELRNQMKRLDETIDGLGKSSNCPTDYSSVGLSVPMVIKRIELMKKLGATEWETEEYRYNHRHFSAIREQYMEEAEKAGDITKLIALLKEGKELDAGDRYKVYRYSSRLAELYHQIKDRLNERNERYEMFVNGMGRDIKLYKTIKALCAEAEWPVYRDGMIAATENKALRCQIYAEEGNVDLLYKLIFEKPEIPLIDCYGYLLAEDHSEEILQIYERHVRIIAKDARNHHAYGQMIDCLCRMQSYSGGMNVVKRLITEWIEAYPTRKKMIEELKKLLRDGLQ